MGRIVGLDYGRARIGIAVSDPLGLTAQPLETWRGSDWDDVVEKIQVLINQMEVEAVVIGYPLTLKGERGRMAQEVEQFAAHLNDRIYVPIILWDERFTSVQAKRIIHEMEEKPSRKKEKVDLITSVLLLQNYLDHQRGTMEKKLEEG